MGLSEITAIITLVPALAWFVAAGVKIYKLYQVKEDEIKKVAAEKAEKLTTKVEEMTEKATEQAKEIKQKVEEKITPPTENDDESEPTTGEGGD